MAATFYKEESMQCSRMLSNLSLVESFNTKAVIVLFLILLFCCTADVQPVGIPVFPLLKWLIPFLFIQPALHITVQYYGETFGSRTSNNLCSLIIHHEGETGLTLSHCPFLSSVSQRPSWYVFSILRGKKRSLLE